LHKECFLLCSSFGFFFVFWRQSEEHAVAMAALRTELSASSTDGSGQLQVVKNELLRLNEEFEAMQVVKQTA
jgi:hypothetical protein